jgi:hypothetical protein
MNKITKQAQQVKAVTAKVRMSELEKELRSIANDATDQESLVAIAWLRAFKKRWKKVVLTRREKCDAYLSIDKKAILIEFKKDQNMQDPAIRARVLAQAIHYYSRFLNGKTDLRTPDVIFVADMNECFALHVNFVNQYVNMIDESLAPSAQHNNAKLMEKLIEDTKLQTQAIVYHIDETDFSPEKIFDKIDQMLAGVSRIVPVTPGTLKKGFDYFCTSILASITDMTANELVGRFYAFMKGQDDAVIANGRLMGIEGYAPVAINETKARQFKARFGVFSETDSQELERLYDTLVGEAERRRNGQFFTPAIFVNEAHRRLARVLGDNWEQECMTWDCCCGTKSLTRDYEHGNLWLSTLDKNELNCSASLSKEAQETFVFDFLNGATATLPKKLVEALKANKDKNIIFFVNPPYGQATSGSGKAHKDGVSKTAVQARMMDAGMGKAANELTIQFLYRFMELIKEFKLTKVTVGLFSNPAWLTGDACEKFRKAWVEKFKFDNSFGFRSEEFAGVKPGWAINFSVWTMGKHSRELQTEFPVDLLENQDGQELVQVGTHTYYNLDGQTKMSEWVRGELPKCTKSVCTTDGIKVIGKNSKSARGSIAPGSLGYLCFNSNVVEKNAQYVILTSLPMSVAHGFNLLPENFDRAVSGFASRKLVENQWYNTRDCYMVPDTANPKYAEWQKDCYIFSMFHSASNQTSIKGEVDGEAYDFKNNFYPFSKKETYELLGLSWKQNSKDETRFIADKLTDLTPEGQKVLDDFKACLKASAKARPEYHKAHPELQVNRYDCGWRQLKGLFEESCPEQFAILKADFKNLKDKMLPLVYELGFLKQ